MDSRNSPANGRQAVRDLGVQTVGEILDMCAARLDSAGITTARLDCLVLLEDATGRDRGWLLAHSDCQLNLLMKGRTFQRKLDGQIARRARHEPLSYIRGRTEFYGREFLINKRVLEPRPESETMIESLLDLVKNQGVEIQNIVDVGTGSGALAITAKLELPAVTVAATDIDPKCLRIARQNARKHGLKNKSEHESKREPEHGPEHELEITFHQADLLKPLPGPHQTNPPQLIPNKIGDSTFYLIMANLPYVPDDFAINQAARWEPAGAIFGGRDGLDVYRALFAQIAKLSRQPEYVLTESLPRQHKQLAKIAAGSGYKPANWCDFVQIFKTNQPFEHQPRP